MSKPNDLDAFFMPFTASRQFKANPRLLTGAQGMYYTSQDGRKIMDGTAGLWCVNAGHGRPSITQAITDQLTQLDYAPALQVAHPKAFELANRLVAMTPPALQHAFFTNSGSESADTAMKIARAYHQARGDTERTLLIGRSRGYHGVNFGGISAGGIANNRAAFGPLLGDTDHICDTHDLARNAFSRGQPQHGAEMADDLLRLIELHGGHRIAAVMVEPVAGSTGVLVPPIGYLERLREICDGHGILLIFDEVITGFGRLGTPFASDYFSITPDIMALAKGLTSATYPMGAVMVTGEIYDAFLQGPEHIIEFFHGYTYSGHPVACAAALATLDIYQDEGLLTRAAGLAQQWEDGLHDLADCPHVIDIRNIGLMGAIELAPLPDAPVKRAFDAYLKAYDQGFLIRTTGDIIALSPPLIISQSEIEQLFACLRDVLTHGD
jgi:beta-alanine--pyruvate transaminase